MEGKEMVRKFLVLMVVVGIIAMATITIVHRAKADDDEGKWVPVIVDPKIVCPECQAQGLKSEVYQGSCSMSHKPCGRGHYDEDGNYVAPAPCNKTTCKYTCSKKHKFNVEHNSY
jgi:hypothetical protein